ncbi:membrane protein, putative [Babesia bigemina]|uniref:Membrane protein, putative n=1 Tax=Babesia bigemina TaxID=5866 RepID=A0A061DC03_BABBI|nr:membrane protein, putative [Babesia bigemina]CDR95285.1 membrane protein, putative [Babesia bigemina]|eukprot:XP_012767471.1 membrane protein, putative [Babesia bigemina]
MKRVALMGALAALLSAHKAAALHLSKDTFTSPHDGDLQFSHMGKVYGPDANKGADNATEVSGSAPATTTPGSSGNTDDVKGGSERSMDNVPVADLKRADSGSGGTNNTSTNNTTSTNTNTNNSTQSDNNSKTDQSQSYQHQTTHGATNYRGDTSTSVTNNFFNPPMPEYASEVYPKGAKLELQYLWKRINVIDDKLDRLMPIAAGDPRLDPSKRKGLIITFDAQSDPDSPTLNLEDSYSDNDAL